MQPVPYELIPDAAVEFAIELGLDWVIEREYPARGSVLIAFNRLSGVKELLRLGGFGAIVYHHVVPVTRKRSLADVLRGRYPLSARLGLDRLPLTLGESHRLNPHTARSTSGPVVRRGTSLTHAVQPNAESQT